MALSDHGQYSGVVDIARNGIDEVIQLQTQAKQDEALIRQLVDALECNGEPDDPGHRCIPMGGFAQIHWDSASFEQIVQAAEAGRARLEGKP